MKIAVTTPVYQTPRAWLEECLASVEGQSIPCTHFLVSDSDETLNAMTFPKIEFLRLPRPHCDTGNAARAIGSVSAIARGFDAIAYLDADNWFAADHLQQMMELQQRTGAAVCSSARNLVDLEGQLLGRCQEVDGERFVDSAVPSSEPMSRKMNSNGARLCFKRLGTHSLVYSSIPQQGTTIDTSPAVETTEISFGRA